MKSNIAKLIGIFLAFVLFSGCTSPMPPAHEYKLSIVTTPLSHEKATCKTKSLKIQNAYGDNIYISLNIYYVKGAYNQYAFSQAKWAQTPRTMITKAITEYLRQNGLFQSVQNSASKTKNDLLLEINIDDFLQYFDENEQNSSIHAAVTCTFIDAKTHKVIAVKTFTQKKKTESNDALGGVKALSSALSSIVKECGLWLKGVKCNDQ